MRAIVIKSLVKRFSLVVSIAGGLRLDLDVEHYKKLGEAKRVKKGTETTNDSSNEGSENTKDTSGVLQNIHNLEKDRADQVMQSAKIIHDAEQEYAETMRNAEHELEKKKKLALQANRDDQEDDMQQSLDIVKDFLEHPENIRDAAEYARKKELNNRKDLVARNEADKLIEAKKRAEDLQKRAEAAQKWADDAKRATEPTPNYQAGGGDSFLEKRTTLLQSSIRNYRKTLQFEIPPYTAIDQSCNEMVVYWLGVGRGSTRGNITIISNNNSTNTTNTNSTNSIFLPNYEFQNRIGTEIREEGSRIPPFPQLYLEEFLKTVGEETKERFKRNFPTIYHILTEKVEQFLGENVEAEQILGQEMKELLGDSTTNNKKKKGNEGVDKKGNEGVNKNKKNKLRSNFLNSYWSWEKNDAAAVKVRDLPDNLKSKFLMLMEEHHDGISDNSSIDLDLPLVRDNSKRDENGFQQGNGFQQMPYEFDTGRENYSSYKKIDDKRDLYLHGLTDTIFENEEYLRQITENVIGDLDIFKKNNLSIPRNSTTYYFPVSVHMGYIPGLAPMEHTMLLLYTPSGATPGNDVGAEKANGTTTVNVINSQEWLSLSVGIPQNYDWYQRLWGISDPFVETPDGFMSNISDTAYREGKSRVQIMRRMQYPPNRVKYVEWHNKKFSKSKSNLRKQNSTYLEDYRFEDLKFKILGVGILDEAQKETIRKTFFPDRNPDRNKDLGNDLKSMIAFNKPASQKDFQYFNKPASHYSSFDQYDLNQYAYALQVEEFVFTKEDRKTMIGQYFLPQLLGTTAGFGEIRHSNLSGEIRLEKALNSIVHSLVKHHKNQHNQHLLHTLVKYRESGQTFESLLQLSQSLSQQPQRNQKNINEKNANQKNINLESLLQVSEFTEVVPNEVSVTDPLFDKLSIQLEDEKNEKDISSHQKSNPGEKKHRNRNHKRHRKRHVSGHTGSKIVMSEQDVNAWDDNEYKEDEKATDGEIPDVSMLEKQKDNKKVSDAEGGSSMLQTSHKQGERQHHHKRQQHRKYQKRNHQNQAQGESQGQNQAQSEGQNTFQQQVYQHSTRSAKELQALEDEMNEQNARGELTDAKAVDLVKRIFGKDEISGGAGDSFGRTSGERISEGMRNFNSDSMSGGSWGIADGPNNGDFDGGVSDYDRNDVPDYDSNVKNMDDDPEIYDDAAATNFDDRYDNADDGYNGRSKSFIERGRNAGRERPRKRRRNTEERSNEERNSFSDGDDRFYMRTFPIPSGLPAEEVEMMQNRPWYYLQEKMAEEHERMVEEEKERGVSELVPLPGSFLDVHAPDFDASTWNNAMGFDKIDNHGKDGRGDVHKNSKFGKSFIEKKRQKERQQIKMEQRRQQMEMHQMMEREAYANLRAYGIDPIRMETDPAEAAKAATIFVNELHGDPGGRNMQELIDDILAGNEDIVSRLPAASMASDANPDSHLYATGGPFYQHSSNQHSSTGNGASGYGSHGHHDHGSRTSMQNSASDFDGGDGDMNQNHFDDGINHSGGYNPTTSQSLADQPQHSAFSFVQNTPFPKKGGEGPTRRRDSAERRGGNSTRNRQRVAQKPGDSGMGLNRGTSSRRPRNSVTGMNNRPNARARRNLAAFLEEKREGLIEASLQQLQNGNPGMNESEAAEAAAEAFLSKHPELHDLIAPPKRSVMETIDGSIDEKIRTKSNSFTEKKTAETKTQTKTQTEMTTATQMMNTDECDKKTNNSCQSEKEKSIEENSTGSEKGAFTGDKLEEGFPISKAVSEPASNAVSAASSDAVSSNAASRNISSDTTVEKAKGRANSKSIEASKDGSNINEWSTEDISSDTNMTDSESTTSSSTDPVVDKPDSFLETSSSLVVPMMRNSGGLGFLDQRDAFIQESHHSKHSKVLIQESRDSGHSGENLSLEHRLEHTLAERAKERRNMRIQTVLQDKMLRGLGNFVFNGDIETQQMKKSALQISYILSKNFNKSKRSYFELTNHLATNMFRVGMNQTDIDLFYQKTSYNGVKEFFGGNFNNVAPNAKDSRSNRSNPILNALHSVFSTKPLELLEQVLNYEPPTTSSNPFYSFYYNVNDTRVGFAKKLLGLYRKAYHGNGENENDHQGVNGFLSAPREDSPDLDGKTEF